MNKPIMDIFGEVPHKWWMKLYANFIYSSFELDTIKRKLIEDNKK